MESYKTTHLIASIWGATKMDVSKNQAQVDAAEPTVITLVSLPYLPNGQTPSDLFEL